MLNPTNTKALIEAVEKTGCPLKECGMGIEPSSKESQDGKINLLEIEKVVGAAGQPYMSPVQALVFGHYLKYLVDEVYIVQEEDELVSGATLKRLKANVGARIINETILETYGDQLEL